MLADRLRAGVFPAHAFITRFPDGATNADVCEIAASGLAVRDDAYAEHRSAQATARCCARSRDKRMPDSVQNRERRLPVRYRQAFEEGRLGPIDSCKLREHVRLLGIIACRRLVSRTRTWTLCGSWLRRRARFGASCGPKERNAADVRNVYCGVIRHGFQKARHHSPAHLFEIHGLRAFYPPQPPEIADNLIDRTCFRGRSGVEIDDHEICEFFVV